MNLKDFPKIELHLHLDGSVLLEVASKFTNRPIDSLKKDMVADTKCLDLNDYLTKFSLPVMLMQEEKQLTLVAKSLVEQLKREHVVYAEVRFAPNKHLEKGLSLEQVVDAVLEGLKDDTLKVNLILCMMRDDCYQDNLNIVFLAFRYLHKGVCGIDLAGAEALYKTENFKELFHTAFLLGIPFTVHAGEADNYTSVLSAISFGAKRIGHGVNAVSDSKTLELLKEKGILLEVCPTSNIQTNICKDYKSHPIKKLVDYGIKVCINTDNRTVSNITLTDEYEHLILDLGYTKDDLIQFNLNSIDGAFLSLEEKEVLKGKYLELIERT
jgi:adenosine deaminase